MTPDTTHHGPQPTEAQPGVLVHPGADLNSAVGHWLLGAADKSDQARQEWAGAARAAMLRCGILFDSIRLSSDVVRAVAGTAEPEKIDAFLADCLNGGPVIRDTYRDRHYLLVLAGTAQRWNVPGVDCLGRGRYLAVPAPGETDPHTAFLAYWSVPMAVPGELCDSQDVARLVAVGRQHKGEVTQ
jgi:hypothetical protein